MPPTYVKGGAWSNVEDEILKAAVQKYGLTQWSRVASLLAKKTAKQAKARWNEWLSPNVKKLEWSREEDEKLLFLAKTMPNQWRSIETILGRTATQCVERYQKLLDDAAGAGSSEYSLSGLSIESSKATGASVGDINLNPESKPAIPDLEDMDDDEREMISEARARLANTQGKKAKRKARERMIEENQRVAKLQKRRELKEAGINTKIKQKIMYKDQMDYNADIPLEHHVPEGPYDVDDEQERNEAEKEKYAHVVNRFGTENEHTKDRKKRKKQEENVKKTSTAAVAYEAAFAPEDDEMHKRRKLNLPAPMQGDTQEMAVGEDDRIAAASRELIENAQKQPTLFAALGAGKDFALGTGSDSEEEEEPVVKVEERPREKLFSLRDKLAALPAPENEIEIEIPEDIDEEEEEEEEILETLKPAPKVPVEPPVRESEVLKRKLPIPGIESLAFSSAGLSDLDNLIEREVVSLITDDIQSLEGKQVPDYIDPKAMKAARDAIESELASLNPPKVVIEADEISTDDIIDVLKKIGSSSNKLEKKLKVLFGGYLQKYETLMAERAALLEEQAAIQEKEAVYSNALHDEQLAIETRSSDVQAGIDFLLTAEQHGQQRLREIHER